MLPHRDDKPWLCYPSNALATPDDYAFFVRQKFYLCNYLCPMGNIGVVACIFYDRGPGAVLKEFCPVHSEYMAASIRKGDFNPLWRDPFKACPHGRCCCRSGTGACCITGP